MDKKCRLHSLIKVDDPTMGATVLEQNLSTTDFEVMLDGTMKPYKYLDDVRTVSRVSTNHGLVIETSLTKW